MKFALQRVERCTTGGGHEVGAAHGLVGVVGRLQGRGFFEGKTHGGSGRQLSAGQN